MRPVTIPDHLGGSGSDNGLEPVSPRKQSPSRSVSPSMSLASLPTQLAAGFEEGSTASDYSAQYVSVVSALVSCVTVILVPTKFAVVPVAVFFKVF